MKSSLPVEGLAALAADSRAAGLAAGYVVDMVGVDHVGFGTDLTEEINPTEMMTETGELGNWPNKPYRPVVYPPLPWMFPPELDSLSKMGNITLGLLARGYSDEDARKIMGGNFLRVFSEVWK